MTLNEKYTCFRGGFYKIRTQNRTQAVRAVFFLSLLSIGKLYNRLILLHFSAYPGRDLNPHKRNVYRILSPHFTPKNRYFPPLLPCKGIQNYAKPHSLTTLSLKSPYSASFYLFLALLGLTKQGYLLPKISSTLNSKTL
jgi:hypothetical protein